MIYQPWKPEGDERRVLLTLNGQTTWLHAGEIIGRFEPPTGEWNEFVVEGFVHRYVTDILDDRKDWTITTPEVVAVTESLRAFMAKREPGDLLCAFSAGDWEKRAGRAGICWLRGPEYQVVAAKIFAMN